VIGTYHTGLNPQHVVPGYDLRTLYVTNDLSNSLTPINPRTGRPAGRNIAVDDPYNMYFTPDGRYAIVVAEARQNLDFRDPHTFALRHRIHVNCAGVDHIDFAATGAYLIATCEFGGRLVRIDLHTLQVAGYLSLPGSAPQVHRQRGERGSAPCSRADKPPLAFQSLRTAWPAKYPVSTASEAAGRSPRSPPTSPTQYPPPQGRVPARNCPLKQPPGSRLGAPSKDAMRPPRCRKERSGPAS